MSLVPWSMSSKAKQSKTLSLEVAIFCWMCKSLSSATSQNNAVALQTTDVVWNNKLSPKTNRCHQLSRVTMLFHWKEPLLWQQPTDAFSGNRGGYSQLGLQVQYHPCQTEHSKTAKTLQSICYIAYEVIASSGCQSLSTWSSGRRWDGSLQWNGKRGQIIISPPMTSSDLKHVTHRHTSAHSLTQPDAAWHCSHCSHRSHCSHCAPASAAVAPNRPPKAASQAEHQKHGTEWQWHAKNDIASLNWRPWTSWTFQLNAKNKTNTKLQLPVEHALCNLVTYFEAYHLFTILAGHREKDGDLQDPQEQKHNFRNSLRLCPTVSRPKRGKWKPTKKSTELK